MTALQTLVLAPLSVHPSYPAARCRRRIGESWIINCQTDEGILSVLVLGHPKYYPGFGFRRASEWGFTIKEVVPSDAFMAIEFVEGGLKRSKESFSFPMELFDE